LSFGYTLSAPRKIVPKSKLTEWRGLDSIASVVHGMRCIWREQEKDDIGIDGEIELCRQRDDGEGMFGTGKIVKVQSKSGFELYHQRHGLDIRIARY
jgi:Domain of unknown function (DUF4365)